MVAPDAPADVEMAFGMNARLPEVSAAILRVQLGRLSDIVAHGRRRRHQLERAFLEATDAPSALRPLLEPDGDNGTSFLFFAPTVDAAASSSTPSVRSACSRRGSLSTSGPEPTCSPGGAR